MKKEKLFVVLLFLLGILPVVADDDVMITRDGSMTPVKIEQISNSQVTFIDLKHKKRGRLKAPTDFVYMIMKEKGNNIFFDEDGNQTTSPVIKFDKKDDVMFLNRGEMFVVYNVSVGKDEVKYQLKDKKKAPWETINKNMVFMIRNSDGTTTLYNDAYQEKQEKQKQQQLQQQQQSTTPTAPTAATVSSTSLLASATPSTAVLATTAATGQQLVTANMDNTKFTPASDMSPTDLEMAVNAVNPYLLYRKGSVAEYCYEENGKQITNSLSGVPTYLRQIVEDEKIVNGQLVAYIRQEAYNKKHEPSKGVRASFKEMLLPTEVDPSGTFHLTHNVAEDLFKLDKRQGYCLLIPGNLQPGKQLQSSTLYDVSKSALGTVKRETVYSNWQVEGEEQIQTPAGTFNCIKLTGKISQRYDKGKFYGQSVTCWMARGIGIVRYERILESDKNRTPFIVYLNSIDIK